MVNSNWALKYEWDLSAAGWYNRKMFEKSLEAMMFRSRI